MKTTLKDIQQCVVEFTILPLRKHAAKVACFSIIGLSAVATQAATVVNANFSSAAAGTLGFDVKIQTAQAGLGWYKNPNSSRCFFNFQTTGGNTGGAVKADGTSEGSILQLINDAKATRGSGSFSLQVFNSNANVRVKVFGYNGTATQVNGFLGAVTNSASPSGGTSFTTLVDAPLSGTGGAVWKTETFSANFGSTGFDYLLICIGSTAISTNTLVDNVALTGGTTQTNSLTVSPTSVSFSSAAGSQTVNITSNVSWTVSENLGWLTPSVTSGSNNGSVSLSATANTGTSARSGNVTISGGGITRVVSVGQSGAATANNDNAPLGMNLGGVSDFAPDNYFLDLTKQSRRWTPLNCGQPNVCGYTESQLDANGFLKPGMTGTSIIMLPTSKGFPYPGQYVLLYQGTGDIVLRGLSLVSSGTGRKVYTVNATSSIYLDINSNSTTDPIRNVHIVKTDFESNYQTQIFHPTIISEFNMFNHIRFMDWGRTNNSTLQNWADRAQVNDFSYAAFGKGVPYEVMADLANRMNVDAWVCIPHLATDDYIRQMSRIFRDRLNSNAKCFIEYSNEVWNNKFAQTTYVRNMGVSLGLASSTQSVLAGLRFTARRSKEIFAIWNAEWGTQQSRIIKVLPGQAQNSSNNANILSWDNAAASADALAIAPYFGISLTSGDNPPAANMTVDQIFTELSHWIQGTGNYATGDNVRFSRVRNNYNLAQQNGLSLIAYEGGQHLVATTNTWLENVAFNDKLNTVNTDGRMYNKYIEYFNVWRQEGGRNFAVFSSYFDNNKFGRWGVKEFPGQALSATPKYRACLDWITNNPKWWTSLREEVYTFDEISSSSDLKGVYPNPSQGIVNINADGTGATKLKIANIEGKEVYSQTLASTTAQIDLGWLPKGMYIVSLANDTHHSVTRILIE